MMQGKGSAKGVFWGISLIVAVVLLAVFNVVHGSVDIPAREVMAILSGKGCNNGAWRFIVLESRLPQTATAVLAGASLAVSGLLLQTAFRNALAGPDIFGISSGASLAVAIVMFVLGGTFSAGAYALGGFVAVMAGAFLGAMAVTGIIFFFSTLVRNNVMLLIIGIMIGYLASSTISLLNFMASSEGVKQYVMWGMGSFGNVTIRQLPYFAILSGLGLILALLLVKPLNAMLLGEEYAESLGVNTRRMRHMLLGVTGLLTAVTTAACGPVAFIGLATPHMARLLLSTANHRQLLPVTMLLGAAIALFCNAVCYLPEDCMIPLNSVTPLIGAPVIIYVITQKRN